MRARFFLGTALLFCPLSSLLAQQSWGYVVKLGRDTIVVERARRVGDHVIGDAVERNPQVAVRHYDATIGADGRVTHFILDSKVGNPIAGRPASQHVEADFRADSIRVAIGTGDSARVTMMANTAALAAPWLLYTYGTYELMFDAMRRRGGDSMIVGTWSPGARALGKTLVRRLGNDSATIDFFGSPIVAKFDRAGHMTSLSGDRTTIKVQLTRIDSPPDIESIATRFAATEKSAGGPVSAMSVRDTTRATVGAAELMVDYGRPQKRGRDILAGSIIQVDSVWRTGANAATQFRTSAPITLAGLKLDAGMYTLWTMRTKSGVTLIVNKQVGQWGTQYDAAKDLGRADLKTEKLSAPIETFTIRVEPAGAGAASLVLEWDTFRWRAGITAGS